MFSSMKITTSRKFNSCLFPRYLQEKKKSSLNCVKLILCYTFCWRLDIFELVVTPTLNLGKIPLTIREAEKCQRKYPWIHHYGSQLWNLLSSLHFLVHNSCFIRVNTNFLTNWPNFSLTAQIQNVTVPKETIVWNIYTVGAYYMLVLKH